MPRVSDVHCPKKLETMCEGCPFFEKIADGIHSGVNYYCTKKDVVC